MQGLFDYARTLENIKNSNNNNNKQQQQQQQQQTDCKYP